MKRIGDRLRQSATGYNIVFWLLVAGCVGLVLFSYPMMKLRYDLWDHVDRIRAMVLDPSAASPAKRYWYACWAFVFRLFDVTDIFTIAIVIHRVQFIANCMLIYFAAKQLFEPLLSLDRHNKHQNEWLSGLALSSVFVWLVTIGTFSFIQQAWIMWYSVNYQITLSFLLLSISLAVNLLTVEQSKTTQITKALMAAGLLILILLFHAGELAYFIFYLPIFIICFGNSLKNKISVKKLIVVGLCGGAVVYLGLNFYKDQTPLLITLLKNNEASKIMELINQKGTWNAVEGGNRYVGNWNELYALSVYLMLLVGFLSVLNVLKMHKRVLAFVVLSLVFCFAPTYVFSSGFLSLVSYDGIVNRYYFASLLFLVVPLCVYFAITKFKFTNHPITLIAITFLMIVSTYSFSKFYNNQGVFYQNVKSIATSLKAKKLDVEVSDSDMIDIKKQIQVAEANAKTSDFIYCGPYAKIYMVAYLYNRKNVYFDRLRDISLVECEESATKVNKYVVYIQ
jgi:hypothetical protein